MPVIRGYESQVAAQGGVNASAVPADFGVALGEGLQRVSASIGEAADVINQQRVMEDTTNVHVQMAAARKQWDQEFQNRVNNAVPGDDAFETKLTEDMADWFSKSSDMAKTLPGRKLFQTLSSTMVSEFGQRAIAAQAQLAGVAARVQTTELIRASGDTVFNNASQRDAVQKNLDAAFDDPNSIYSKIPKPKRQELRNEAKNAVDQAAVMGMAQRGELLSYLAEPTVAQFKPWENLIRTYVAPGGRLNLSPTVLAQAQSYTQAAAKHGLNPNILMAQADQKSGVVPGELAKDMGQLVDRYGGDYARAVAAYKMGTAAVDAVLKVNGSAWKEAIPEEARAYVDSIMQNSGSVPVEPVAAIAEPEAQAGASLAQGAPAVVPSPVRNAPLSAFNGLTWEQQHQATNEAVRVQHLRMTMATHARAEAERLQTKQQEATFNDYVTRIYDPRTEGGYPSIREVADDKILTGHQKNQVVGIMFAYQRELRTAAETKSNPEALNRLARKMVEADNDPTQAPSMDASISAFVNHEISFNDYRQLQGFYVGLKDSNGNSFAHQLHEHVQEARRAFLAMPQFLMQPEAAEQAAARLRGDLQDKVTEYRKAGKNPRTLLDPSSPDYFFKPGVLKSYTVGARGSLERKVDAAMAQEFEVGKQYKVNGKMRTYLGGSPTLSKNWRE